ncbi:MAG: hypothetical protein J0L92_01310 [Deltaproteobacteria bacterium]|nr:hypothetical protein [Deltaproteobacteria bacterium]
MADMSKTTADKLAFSRAIEEAYAVHGGEVAAKFSQWLFDGGAPRALSVSDLFELVAVRLRESGKKLADADLTHQAELGDDVQPRQDRDAREAELKECLVRSSDMIRGAFGERYSRAVGLETPLAERGDLLVKQARTSAKLLRETKPPEVRRRSASSVNVADEAALLEEAASAVEAAVAAVKKEEVEAQKTLIAREDADAKWATAFTCAGDLLATAATVAGVNGVAERVKTNWRRRSGIADPKNDTDGPPEDTGDPNDPNNPYAPGGPFGPPKT